MSDDVTAATMGFSPDLAREIERMLSKMDAGDKATFNECIFMARGFRGSFEAQLADARRQAVEEAAQIAEYHSPQIVADAIRTLLLKP